MTNEHRDRATAVKTTNRRKDSDSPWAKRGVAGKVQQAKRTAPDGIEGLKILAVAHAAYERDVSVEQIWREVQGGER